MNRARLDPAHPALQPLIARPRWVGSQFDDPANPDQSPISVYRIRRDRAVKVPIPDARTGGSWSEAEMGRAIRSPRIDGVAYILAGDSSHAVVELYDARDPATGRLTPLAQALVEADETYIERTCGGTGVVVWLARLEGDRTSYTQQVSVRVAEGFVAVTGQALTDQPITSAPRTRSILREACQRHLGSPPALALTDGQSDEASEAPGASLDTVSVTVFTSDDRLSKRFEPGPHDSIRKVSGVTFSSGHARRVDIPLISVGAALKAVGDLIGTLGCREAIGLGIARNGKERNRIVTRERKGNGIGDGIARTLEDFAYAEGPGLLLVDGDGVTGLREILIRLWPSFATIATLARPSASAGIRHGGTGETLAGGGEHLYLVVDLVERSREVLDALMRLAWKHGLGSLKVAANGVLLVRGPVDVTVASPERLSYEGKPEIIPPIESTSERAITVVDGDILRVEPFLEWAGREAPEALFESLKQEAARNPALHEMQKLAHATWLERRIAHKIATGTSEKQARAEAAVEHKAFTPGILSAGRPTVYLTPSDVFEADDGRLIRLADVLERPQDFDGVAGADPGEGVAYGRSKAKIYAGTPERGGPFIHSFAHGGIDYRIRSIPDEPPRPLPGLHVYGDAETPPSVDFTVHGLMPITGKGILSGQFGTAKTWMILEMAGALMSGTSFLGHPVVRLCGTLIIAAEGATSLPQRLRGLLEHRLAEVDTPEGWPPLDLAHPPLAWIDHCPVTLASGDTAFDAIMPYVRETQRRFAERGFPLGLIIIDTAMAASGLGPEVENDAGTMNKVYALLDRISRAADAFVLAVDHLGKDTERGTRGSSAKDAAADLILHIRGKRAEDGTLSNLSAGVFKNRHGPTGAAWAFSLKMVEVDTDESGLPIPSAFIVWEDAPASSGPPTGRPSVGTQRFLKALDCVLIEFGQDLHPTGDSPRVRAVDIEHVRREAYALHVVERSDDPTKQNEAKLKAFKRGKDDAEKRGLIGTRNVGGIGYVWRARNE